MKEERHELVPDEICMASTDRQTRLEELSVRVTAENMHDGSATSLEFARLAVEVFDAFLDSIDFLLGSPHVSILPLQEKENMEAYAVEIRGRRAKAQRAVEINLARSLEAGRKE